MNKSKVLLLILAFLGSTLPTLAQTSRGTVSGIVTDANGAAIAGAHVVLTNPATTVSRSTETNKDGLYRFDAVELGTYVIKFNAPNFGELSKSSLIVSANQISTIDAELSVGNQVISLDVTAEAGSLLQVEAPVRGGNIDATRITELPIGNRNPVSLALTLPGVSTNRFGFGVGTFVVNGGRGRSNNFLIDGTENNDISVAGQGFQIKNPDAVVEVSVQTSNYDAEFGRAGGAVINTITRSGTNQYHGTVSWQYDSTRDDAITNTQLSDAIRRRGYAPYGTEHVFAGTFGGPIKLPRFGIGGPRIYDGKDRTFFFVAYQNQRQASNTTASVLVPSAAGRAALTSLLSQPGVNSYLATYLNLTSGALGADNLRNITLGPSPSGLARPGSIEFGTAVTAFAQTYVEPQFQGRIDHRVSEKSQLWGRYLFADQNAPVGGATLGLPGFTTSQKNRYQNFLISETHTFSPSITNELRLSYNRILLSFPLDPPNTLALTLPSLTIAGVTNVSGLGYNVGIQTNLPQGRVANNYVIQDTVTLIKASHTFRFGFDLLKQRSRQFAPINERGSLTYNATDTVNNGLTNFIDDFSGSGGSANRDFGSPSYYPELFRQAYFFQDRWRLNEALTLTLGLRYENFGNPVNSIRTAAYTGLFNVDPVTFQGPYTQPSQAKNDNNNFAPTIGIAYSPSFRRGLLGGFFGDKKSVIRAGYQIGYDSFFNNIASNAATSSPNIVSTQVTAPSSATSRGLTGLSNLLPTAARPLSPLDGQVLVDGRLVNPYYQRWSVGLQRELPGQLMIDISYVGSKGTKLYLNEDRNPLVPVNRRITPAGFTGSTTCTPGTAGCLISGRLDNLQGPRQIRGNAGGSSYQSGQLLVSRRFGQGLSVNGSYTYSKQIDNGSEIFASGGLSNGSLSVIPLIFGGEGNDRAVSLFDRTHRAVLSYVYDLPLMREQKGILGQIVGGWQLSGITTFESGVPFTVFNGVDSNGVGGNNDRPDFNPSGRAGVRAIPATAANPSSTGYINPDNNNAPIDPREARYIGLLASAGRTGTLGRNTERTKGINNFDFTVQKQFRLAEGTTLQFRTEFFNLFNHPQYGTSSVSPFAQASSGPSANVFTSPSGTFLQPQLGDGGGRVIRYLLRLSF